MGGGESNICLSHYCQHIYMAFFLLFQKSFNHIICSVHQNKLTFENVVILQLSQKCSTSGEQEQILCCIKINIVPSTVTMQKDINKHILRNTKCGPVLCRQLEKKMLFHFFFLGNNKHILTYAFT